MKAAKGYSTELMSKSTWVLLQIAQNKKPAMFDDLAKQMGHKMYVAIDGDVNILRRNGLVEITEEGVCPHCGKPIQGLKLKKGSKMIKITEKGTALVNQLKEAIAIIDKSQEA